ncbi:hypothetical protein [Bacillus sp. Hm123]|uniref:hypothetical protein n=1 Tax=Bacillus sp. Hm123 TaxID=3450745 RepID=UPI003F42F5DE
MFEVDMDSIFSVAAVDIKINDEDRKGIITNPKIASNEMRHIHTLDLMKRGDVVTYDDVSFLITSETITKRHSKYKAIMQHCNFNKEIPGGVKEEYMRDEDGNLILDDFGRPIPIEVELPPVKISGIIDQDKMGINYQQFILTTGLITLTLQDNEKTRETFPLDYVFEYGDSNWKVINRDFTKSGLIILSCEKSI